VDVRLITATHQDLLQAVEERRFRSDLYYRICAIAIKVPPLRERGSDVCILARSFLDEFAALGRGPLVFSPEAELSLRRYHWPGNIRELRNVIERAALLSDGPTITPEGLGLAPRPQTAAIETDTSLTLEELERRHIEAVLAEVGGRVDAAARRLGIHRSSLYNKLKRYRAEPSES
jgi:DNA-binding NtrC family response regulator